MKTLLLLLAFVAPSLALADASKASAPTSHFDGKSLADWHGDTTKTWRVQDGRIAVQIHGGGKAESWFKDIEVQEL